MNYLDLKYEADHRHLDLVRACERKAALLREDGIAPRRAFSLKRLFARPQTIASATPEMAHPIRPTAPLPKAG